MADLHTGRRPLERRLGRGDSVRPSPARWTSQRCERKPAGTQSIAGNALDRDSLSLQSCVIHAARGGELDALLGHAARCFLGNHGRLHVP